MYEPVLPLGTTLTVLDEPVEGSGYTWYKVTPVTFAGLSGPGFGWVAQAGKDGEPWIGPAEGPLAELALAFSPIERAPADPRAAQAVADSINAFGLDFYRALLADEVLELGDDSVVFSPASIALAFGMVQPGARGQTAAEIYDVFHTTGWEAFGPGLNALDQALTARDATWKAHPDAGETHSLILRIANAAFAQRDWEMQQAYLDAIASALGAGVRLVDYIADPEAARQIINRWVSDRTEERIPELLLPEDVSDLTRLTLVNAVYLKGEWANTFDERSTGDAPFTRLDGTQASVPTMRQQASLPYAAGPGWQATQLEILGGPSSRPLAMTLIRPDSLASFEDGLTAQHLDAIIEAVEGERDRAREEVECPAGGPEDDCGCHRYDVELFLPRFGIDTRASLREVLRALGMELAFTAAADFSGIPAEPDAELHISDVIHQANIDVDETGCEAAAATAIVMGDIAACRTTPTEVHTLRFDRPFLFALRDIETGAILFMGRVVDPSVSS
jgi:serpin B